MLCARVHNTVKGTHGVKVDESDLMELRKAYSLSMLLRNVRQILVPRSNESKESFDRVIKMRRSLAKGLREIIVSPDEIRGEGFVMLPSETRNS
jgi:1-acyl-sn-glycerol-3-phosphate acyltransferase